MDQKVTEMIKESINKLDTVYKVMDTIKLDGMVHQARLVGSGNEILTVKGILEQALAQADPAETLTPVAGEEAGA